MRIVLSVNMGSCDKSRYCRNSVQVAPIVPFVRAFSTSPSQKYYYFLVLKKTLMILSTYLEEVDYVLSILR